MRKNAGFIITTLLLLIVPALANAWTLTVKVTGAAVGTDLGTVTYNSTSQESTFKHLKIGTNYFYPGVGAVIFAVPAGPTFKLDGISKGGVAALNNALTSPTAGSHTVTVTYPLAVTTYKTLTLSQTEGGLVYAKNRNNTWTSTGVIDIPESDPYVQIAIAADFNHKILGYRVNGGDMITAGMPTIHTPGEVISISLAANNQIITPVFDVYGKVSANLFAPTNGVTNRAVNCTVTATSNTTGLQYGFEVTGPTTPFTQAASTNPTFAFTPTVAGTYTVTATVESAHDGSTTATANVVVADAQTDANSQCVSCHSSSFPAVVNDYKASKHGTNALTTCVACHTADAPHSAAINHNSISPATFKVISTSVSTTTPARGTFGTNFCANCHTDTSRNYLTSHAAPSPKNNPNCSSCHVTVHNPNPLLGGAIQFETLADSAAYTALNLALPSGSGPKGITTDGTNLYVTDFDRDVILKVSISEPPTVSTISTGGVTFNGPVGITTDGTNLYVCDSDNHKIRKVVIATGVVTTIAGTGEIGFADGPGYAAKFNYPYFITTDGVNLYVTDYYNDKIRKIAIATGVVTTIPASPAFAGPAGITTDGTNLYVTDQDRGTVSVVIATGVATPISTTQLSTPVGITTDGTNLYVAGNGSNSALKMPVSGGDPTTIAAGNSEPISFNLPFGITTDGINLYVADYGNHVIQRLTPITAP